MAMNLVITDVEDLPDTCGSCGSRVAVQVWVHGQGSIELEWSEDLGRLTFPKGATVDYRCPNDACHDPVQGTEVIE